MMSRDVAAPLGVDFEITTSGGIENKVMPLAEAVRRFIAPRQHVHIAYADARPNAAILEIVRQFRGKDPAFTVSTAGLVNTQHALIAEGLVERLITSFVGENYPSPAPSRVAQRALDADELTIEDWSLWSLTARLMAGALGVPFFPVHSVGGSDLETEHLGSRYVRLDGAFDDGEAFDVGVVRALRPDVVLVQAVASDPYGNVVLAAPYGESYWGALAARGGVIACVEEVVSTETIREHGALVRVPGHVVRAVCHTPFGSHPYGLFNPGLGDVPGYAQDGTFMAATRAAMRDADGYQSWAEEWIHGLDDHNAYLAKLGQDRLATLRGLASKDVWRLGVGGNQPPTLGDEVTDGERMVVAASRFIAERIATQEHRVVLAGVGYSNLAAWLAVRDLWERGTDVHLMAEIGMHGYDPRPGDPFIFSNRNLSSCTALTDVATVIGSLVSGPASGSFGVVGAAQIDRHGRINSTVGSGNRRLVGSGGANDIASAAREVVVTLKHDPTRLVDSVPYVTSPGDRVVGIITDECVMERRDGEFQVVRYLQRDGASEQERIDEIRSKTGWDVTFADDLAPEEPPSEEARLALASFDPEGVYTGAPAASRIPPVQGQ